MRLLDKVYLEITNTCNLRCDFCPPVRRPLGFLSARQFRLILEKLRGRVRTLYFHLKGEPLLHPMLGDFLTLAAETGFRVILTTNGTLLANRLADLQGKVALDRLNVSLHALPGLPEAAQARQLADILEAVQDLAGPVHVSLRLWAAADTQATAAILVAVETRFGLASGSLDAALSAKPSAMLAPAISLHQAERFDWPRLHGRSRGFGKTAAAEGAASAACDQPCLGAPDHGDSGFCRGLRDQAGILLDGTVVPCCLDADGIINLGNIYRDDWDEIRQSGRAMQLYEGFSQRRVVEPLCRACSYRERFQRPAVRVWPVAPA